MVLDPTTGKMVSAPEYGGTFTWADSLEPPHCDSYLHGWGPRVIDGVAEKLGLGNWAVDRNEHSFADPWVPLRFMTGALAESWEMVDPLTYVFQAYQPRNRPVSVPLSVETAVAFNLREQSIYNDIRVRKAMQMAIDLETINDTYFMGLAKTKPQGIVGDGMKGFTSWAGLCLTIVVYSLNMFGDAVRDLFDPRLRGGQGSYGGR